MPRPASQLPTLLSRKLRDARRTAILAVGSHWRGDDAAGLLVAAALRRRLGSRLPRGIRLVLGETVPENLTGELRRYAPTHLVVVDGAEFGGRPGAVRLIEPAGLSETRVFSTHHLPLTVMLDYLHESLHCQIVIVGIQPGAIGFGQPPTRAICRTADRLATHLLTALGRRPPPRPATDRGPRAAS